MVSSLSYVIMLLKVQYSVYYTLFYSHMVYACSVWSLTSKDNLDRINILKKKCVRLMNFSQYNSHTPPLFIKDKLITFLDIITSNKLQLAFDFKSNTLPEDLCILFHLNSTLHSYTTHSVTKEGFFVPGIQSTSYGIKTLKYCPCNLDSFALSNPELCDIKYSFQLKGFLKDHFIS